jgi:type IV pilus assembly protein PilX
MNNMTPRGPFPTHINSSKGSVLIVTLLVLLMLHVLAITQISLNTTQTHIATNSADAQIAFQTAEGALNEATNNLFANSYNNAEFLSNTNGLYLHDPNLANRWTNIDYDDSSAMLKSFQGGSYSQGQYIIELMPSIILPGQNMSTPTQVYRITSRAVGASGDSPVLLQSTLQIQE